MKYKIQVCYTENDDFGDYPHVILDTKDEALLTISKLILSCEKHEKTFRLAEVDEEEAEQYALDLFKWYNSLR